MILFTILGRIGCRTSWKVAYVLIIPPLITLLITYSIISSFHPEILLLESPNSAQNTKKVFKLHNYSVLASPYHNWELFDADYHEMLNKFKIFVYPDVWMNNESSPFARIFRPHPDPLDPKIGNYYSEHAFKLALLQSSFVTKRPEEAQFLFMPFSINAMRNHPLLRSESSISDFVANYVSRISTDFPFWNASGGADHFFVCCHSVGREAASKHFDVRNNAIQITCSSSYFQRLYTAHKDIALPQIWPRRNDQVLNPPNMR